jgi:hypothetical protein
VLCADGDVRVLEDQNQWPTDDENNMSFPIDGCLQLFPWSESSGTSQCLPQLITETYHLLPGSIANALAIVQYAVACDCELISHITRLCIQYQY